MYTQVPLNDVQRWLPVYRLQGHGRRTHRILLSILLLTSDIFRTNRTAGRPEACSDKNAPTMEK